MNRTSLVMLAALAVVTIAPASAQRLFGRGGENAPSKTDREEARQALIDEFDADGDGVLNKEEREAAKEARAALRAERPQMRQRGARRGSFAGRRPTFGGDRAARTQAIIDRMKAAIESGELPEGVTPEQAAEGLAKRLRTLSQQVSVPTANARPTSCFPKAQARSALVSLVVPFRVQAIIDRISAAIESGNLPEGVSAEQAADRIAMLQQALETGERPEGQRPEGVGRRKVLVVRKVPVVVVARLALDNPTDHVRGGLARRARLHPSLRLKIWLSP
ncbi:MAG: hypothetical protein R3F19_31345 [Verrucomicrobiales bacterium]